MSIEFAFVRTKYQSSPFCPQANLFWTNLMQHHAISPEEAEDFIAYVLTGSTSNHKKTPISFWLKMHTNEPAKL